MKIAYGSLVNTGNEGGENSDYYMPAFWNARIFITVVFFGTEIIPL